MHCLIDFIQLIFFDRVTFTKNCYLTHLPMMPKVTRAPFGEFKNMHNRSLTGIINIMSGTANTQLAYICETLDISGTHTYYTRLVIAVLTSSVSLYTFNFVSCYVLFFCAFLVISIPQS